jgi:hypothetical protein
MREHVHTASERRDQRLALIRKITLWITGGAAAASLGFGTAFAHAVPGHSTAASTPPRNSTPSAATGSRSAGSGSAGSGSPGSGSAGSGSAGSGSAGSGSSQLSQPQQQPAHTTAPPAVTSGGS